MRDSALAIGEGSTAISTITHNHHYAPAKDGKASSPAEINNIFVPGGVDSLTNNHYQDKLSKLFSTYRVVCIHGMGGTGKSTLAKTEVIKKDIFYAVRFQITGHSDDVLLSDLMNLYEACVGETKAQALRKHLNQEGDDQKRATNVLMRLRSTLHKEDHTPSLIVLDDIKKETPLLRQVIDTLTETRFLITTRDNQMLISRSQGAQPTLGSLSLNTGWTQEECLNLLGEGLGSLEERKALADYLPFPLGLKVASQTIRYMRKNPRRGYSCEKYLSTIRSGLNDCDERKVLTLSLEDLDQRQTEVLKQSMLLVDSQGGKALLQFIRNLAPLPIPYFLINDYFDHRFSEQSESDRMDLLEEGVRQLESLSLVDSEMEEGSIHALRVHEIVQDVARRACYSNIGDKTVVSKTFMPYFINFDSRLLSDPAQRSRIQLVLPHVETLARNTNREDVGMEPVYRILGNVYAALGDAKKSNELLERALVINEAHYGAEHYESAMIIYNLGVAYLKQKNMEHADNHFRKAYRLFNAHHGAEHQYTKMAKKALDLIALEQLTSGNNGAPVHGLFSGSESSSLVFVTYRGFVD